MSEPAIKRATEVKVYTFSYVLQSEIIAGETIVSVDSVWSIRMPDGLLNDPALMFGSTAIADIVYQGVTYPSASVKVTVSGGTNETGYDLYVRAITNNAHKLVCKGKLYVGDGA